MVSRTSKMLILNAVRHTESHNRRQEENEMWHQRHKEIGEPTSGETSERDEREGHRHQKDLHHGFKRGGYLEHGDGGSSKRRAHSPPTSNKWAVELMKYEESLGDERWGHGGYKELYPEEFKDTLHTRLTDASDEETSSHSNKIQKKKKKHKKEKAIDKQGSPAKKKKHHKSGENNLESSKSVSNNQSGRKRAADEEKMNKHKGGKKKKKKKDRRDEHSGGGCASSEDEYGPAVPPHLVNSFS